jgi:membrane associated rhomboid family serine protease
MRSRYSGAGTFAYSFGPGPLTPAVKALLIANTVMFVATVVMPELPMRLGLRPASVIGGLAVWQLVTYLFLHGSFFHILFNMLTLWMFGVELERRWGTPYFLQYYFIVGVGAALTTLVVSLLPFSFAAPLYFSSTIGASGAIYGLLMAYALYFPDRPIYMYFFFPIPAKYFVLILGAIAFFLSISDTRGGVAHATHLGGLLFGYAYLKRGRGGLAGELKYRYLKWKMNRMRKRFDVVSGGRSDRIH